MYARISFCTTLLLKLVRNVSTCTKHTAVTSQLPVHYKTTKQFNLHTKMAFILVCFKLVASYPGKLVVKCLCKLASLIKSICHLVSSSYDSKVSIYTYINLLVHLAWQYFRCLREHGFINSSLHYYVKHFTLMLAMFTKLFVQCTVYHHEIFNIVIYVIFIKFINTYSMFVNILVV